MSSFVQKLSRSFTDTLFYIWTVIQALLSLRSPNPFPFRETSTMMPYPPDVDLESGSGGRQRSQSTTQAPSLTPLVILPSTPFRNAVERALVEDARRQESLRYSPAFSISPLSSVLKIEQRPPEASLSASSKESSLDSATNDVTLKDHESPPPSIPSPAKAEVLEDVFSHSRDMSLDPFLDAKPAFPFVFAPEVKDHRQENVEPVPFKLPFCTSTPPRTPKAKGHKRAPMATITNIAHLDIPVSFVESLPSPTVIEPLVDTPLVQKLRSPSLRRKPAYEDLHSPSRVRSSPSRSSHPSVISTSSTQEIHFKCVSPLRIVKRNGTNPSCGRASAMSEVSKALTSAVRDALIQTREEGQDDEGMAARELINRESVWTCATVPTGPSRRDMGVVLEGEESEEEYGEEVTLYTSCSPPPPYAFSNPSFKATPRRSTEHPYLQGHTPCSSVDSCLDDILESFEQLMATMPKFQDSLTRSQVPRLSTTGDPEKGIGATSSVDTKCIIPDGDYAEVLLNRVIL